MHLGSSVVINVIGLADKIISNTSTEAHSKMTKNKTQPKDVLGQPKDVCEGLKHSKKNNPPEVDVQRITPRPNHPQLPDNTVVESRIIQTDPPSSIETDSIIESRLSPSTSKFDLHFVPVETKIETNNEDMPEDIQIEENENEWPFRETIDSWRCSSHLNSIPIPYSEAAHPSESVGAGSSNQTGIASEINCGSNGGLPQIENETLLMSTPSGSKSFTCQLCSYRTDRKFNLKLHLRRRHKMPI